MGFDQYGKGPLNPKGQNAFGAQLAYHDTENNVLEIAGDAHLFQAVHTSPVVATNLAVVTIPNTGIPVALVAIPLAAGFLNKVKRTIRVTAWIQLDLTGATSAQVNFELSAGPTENITNITPDGAFGGNGDFVPARFESTFTIGAVPGTASTQITSSGKVEAILDVGDAQEAAAVYLQLLPSAAFALNLEQPQTLTLKVGATDAITAQVVMLMVEVLN